MNNENQAESVVHAIVDEILPAENPNSPAPKKPGILSFVGNLLVNSAFLGSGARETAILRGSLAGLASGVEAVASNLKDPAKRKGALSVIATVGGYVAGGLVAAYIYRSMRRPAV